MLVSGNSTIRRGIQYKNDEMGCYSAGLETTKSYSSREGRGDAIGCSRLE